MTWVLWQDIDEGAKLDCFSSYRMCNHRYQHKTDKQKDYIPPPQPQKSQTKIVEKWFYNYRLISYIIKATVNKCKHSQISHDEATNTLLRGSENTKNPDGQGDRIP